jgi:hypothetical protein
VSEHADPNTAEGTFCPYVGLEPFDAAHADYFFGRSADAADLANHFLARSVTVLYGTSGVGKSSLLNVGVQRALSRFDVQQGLRIFRQWFPVGRLTDWLSTVEATTASRLLLAFDQFEEFFLYREPGQVEEFAQELRRMLRDPTHDVHVLFAARNDALHLLDGLRTYLPQIFDTTLELGPLNPASVREAIEGPIRVYNGRYRPANPIQVENALVDYLIDEGNWTSASDESTSQPSKRVELSFLQLALTKLWEAEGGGKAGALRVATLREDLQGIDGIANRHIDEKLNALTRGEQRSASKILHYLVTPSGGKIAYTQRDLEIYGATVDLTALLDKLTRDRVLRRVQDDTATAGGTRYELFHDMLAQPLLKWRATYLNDGPFACFRHVFTGKDYELHGFGELFGRFPRTDDRSVHEPMSQTEISRNHLIVLSNFELLDLRSRNGTTLNSHHVPLGAPKRLETGDVVVLADIVPVVFFSIEDEQHLEGFPPPDSRFAWAAVIDGSARRISYVTSHEAHLRYTADNGVDIGTPDDPGVFATLSRSGTLLTFKPVESRPSVTAVMFKDSYNFPHITLKDRFPPSIPDTEEFEDARAVLVFLVEEVAFQIVLNEMPSDPPRPEPVGVGEENEDSLDRTIADPRPVAQPAPRSP